MPGEEGARPRATSPGLFLPLRETGSGKEAVFLGSCCALFQQIPSLAFLLDATACAVYAEHGGKVPSLAQNSGLRVQRGHSYGVRAAVWVAAAAQI